ncbi:MAG: hypothetical protein GYB67_06265 [Chloroflexi bacterium]|nr:hypothetical protein [Chloroflexota bacterium]
MDAPSAMPNSLQPMTVVQVVDLTFRVYREHFIPFIGLVAVITVPLTIITLIAVPPTPTTFNPASASSVGFTLPPEFWINIAFTLILGFIQLVLVNGLITYITSEFHLGRKVGLGEALTAGISRLGTLALGIFYFGLLFIPALFILGALTVLCGLVVFTLPVVLYLGIALYFFIVPVLMLENVGASFGISRALALGKARFWRALGLFILIYIITLIITIVLGVVVGFVTVGTSQPGSLVDPGFVTLTTIAQTIVNILIIPILPIAFTIMYYDTRVRLEGLDIALAAVGTPDPSPADVESPRPTEPILAGRDIGNIALLAVGVIGVTLAFGALGMGLTGLLLQ